MATTSARLEGWTPIGFSDDPEPRLEWADLRDHRFDGSFLGHIVEAWRKADPRPTGWSELSALADLESLPSLDPGLIIAQAARCGSTLLARQMAGLDGAMSISEPGFLGRLLIWGIDEEGAGPTSLLLRRLVRALGRVRFGDERRFILKLSSSLTRFLPLFRAAFPKARIVWLQRRPAEIVASELRGPGRWLGPVPQDRDALAVEVLRKLTTVFLSANAYVTDDMLVLDYRDLPGAAWTRVAPFVGAEPTAGERARMAEVARNHSKTGKPFAPHRDQPLSPAVRAMVEQTLDPLYDALDRRRTGAGSTTAHRQVAE